MTSRVGLSALLVIIYRRVKMVYDEFSQISRPEYYNKEINIKGIVSGKGEASYYIPQIIAIKCADRTGKCGCDYSESTKVEINKNNPDILLFVDLPSSRFNNVVKQIFKIPCKVFYAESEKMYTIERIFIGQIPGEAKKSTKETHVAYVAYYIGHGIESNTSYTMKGYVTADPITQKATPIITECTKIRSSIDTFRLKEVYPHLVEFQVSPPTKDELNKGISHASKILQHLDCLYNTYSKNITKITNRFDLHLALDLVFHSVLYFKLGEDRKQKGWLDVMVIGDSSTGKGFVAEGLAKYYNIGEIISGENASYAGLIGGLEQLGGKHWIITWGRIALNDTGLLIIDEASNLGDDIWTRLSRIRSEGIAEITKMRTQSTSARTRLIFLNNPIDRSISSYSYGIEAIHSIVKAQEDVRRFDYVLVVSHKEVSMNEINKPINSIKPMYSRFLEQQLILWIWSRKPEEIVFTKEAQKKIYDAAIAFGDIYDFSIPLIQGENIRIKIARIAIAFAGRLFSNIDNGKILLVDVCHVECACVFLNIIYKKDCSGYYQKSVLKKMEGGNEDWYVVVDKYMGRFTNRMEVCKYFMKANTFTSRDLMEYLGVQQSTANEMISKLLHNNCLEKKTGYYVKTTTFNEYLKGKLLGA